MKLTSKTITATTLVAISALTLTATAGPNDGTKPLSKQVIKKFDADKNGTLEGEEVKTLLAAVAANKKEVAAAMLKRFDADKDGTLSKEEAKAGKKAVSAEKKEIKAASIKKFDTDGDGKLKGSERKGVKAWIKETYPNAIPKVLIGSRYKLPTA